MSEEKIQLTYIKNEVIKCYKNCSLYLQKRQWRNQKQQIYWDSKSQFDKPMRIVSWVFNVERFDLQVYKNIKRLKYWKAKKQ